MTVRYIFFAYVVLIIGTAFGLNTAKASDLSRASDYQTEKGIIDVPRL